MKSMEKKEIAEVIASEGLGYSVEHIIEAKHIEDEKLAKAWQEAQNQLQTIQELLKPYR